jgi:electron transfer flavoprotein alpha subunit
VTAVIRVLFGAGGEDEIGLVAAAREIATRGEAHVEAIIVGRDPSGGLAQAALERGADAVALVAHRGLQPDAAEDAWVAVFAAALGHPAFARPPRLTLLASGEFGDEMAARLAMRMNGVPLGRCSRIGLADPGVVITRNAFGGCATAMLRAPANGFATLRAATGRASAASNSGEVRRVLIDAPLPPAPQLARREVGAGRKRLEGARVVVGGGRGVGGEEGFALLDALAARLDAALGGSLPTVDAGWVPVASQVGQSGKYVTPELYVAVGISGTPQHLAGIGPETRIVAINKDAGAEIFRVAEVGMVGDWREVLPALVERLADG